jgi:glycosyltransferase involved in cell wall biosynthesis
VNGCTIIAPNYLPYARVLARSFFACHPTGRFVTLVLDPHVEDDGSEPFEIRGPYQIGLEAAEVHRMAMIYDVKELATAVKPFLLQSLLDEGLKDVAYLDPDMMIFASLDDVAELARAHAVVLTPHLTAPLPDDGCLPDELMILRSGSFNLGFIAVGQEASPFLDWWSRHLRRDCLVAVEKGMFVDQRWVDLVPGLFPHHVFADRTVNVAYWNLNERAVTRTTEGYRVNGAPLRLFHFTGFKPDAPHLLSAHMGGRPRIRLSAVPDVAKLCREYADLLLLNGYGASDGSYAWDFLTDGTPIEPIARRRYRQDLLANERAGGPAPPAPFDPSTERAFSAWMVERGVAPQGISDVEARLRTIVVAHPVLGHAKPVWRLARLGARRARAMVRKERGPRNPDLELEIDTSPVPGFNIVGHLRAELGVAEVARQIVTGAQQAGIASSAITYRRSDSRQEHPVTWRDSRRAPYDVNVVCVNADQLPSFRDDVGSAFFRDRYTVGVWFWEVSTFPKVFHKAFELVDELWVASEFVRDAIAPETDKPVHVIPLPVGAVHQVDLPSRDELGLPDRFIYLFTFDYLSVFERKNPIAVVSAFKQAFAPDEGPVLLIKSINGDRDIASLEKLLLAVEDRRDILVWDEYRSAQEMRGLVASSACYVSLHRSEGYGLTMAEAMSLGKPVIATAYSGNLTFMHDSNSYLVPFRLIPVGPRNSPYPSDAQWADPDVEVAARLMRRVYEHHGEARERAVRARADLDRRHRIENTASFLAMRFAAIHHEGARWCVRAPTMRLSSGLAPLLRRHADRTP